MLTQEDFIGIFTSFSIWTSIYIVIAVSPLPFKHLASKISKENDLDVRNRMVSFLHGVTLIIFSCYEFYFTPGSCGDKNTLYETRLLYTAIGYFLYDFLAMAYYGLLDMTMTFHHWVCIIGMVLPLYYNVSANYVVMGMFISEASNPFMHVRVILRQYGLRYTKAYELMEILFLIFYIFGRLMLGTSLVFSNCLCDQNMIIIKFCSLALWVQSIFFIF